MEIKILEQDGVIIRQVSGEVIFEDLMESWNILFASYPNLKNYKGILTSFLDARVKHEDNNLNALVEFFKEHLDQLQNLKIAMVMDTPMVTNTIILGQRVRSLQIKPFSTMDAAMLWISH
ncbi:MAG: hypothetical protein P1P86_08475 [Bacteroidales bacterium]|nr:hypothetical protein [Bacteroidales bacterium]